MAFQEMARSWWIETIWLRTDAEHPNPPVEGIEHPPNTIRAPKGTFNEHILFPKIPEILNEIVWAATVKS